MLNWQLRLVAPLNLKSIALAQSQSESAETRTRRNVPVLKASKKEKCSLEKDELGVEWRHTGSNVGHTPRAQLGEG